MAVVDSPFSEEEKVALVKHLNWALGEAGGAPDEHVGARLPLNPHTDSWLDALPDGLPLSKFVMHVDPEALDARARNIPKDGAPLSDKDALQVTGCHCRHRLHHHRRRHRCHRLTSASSPAEPHVTERRHRHRLRHHQPAAPAAPQGHRQRAGACRPFLAPALQPRASRPRRTPHHPRFSHSHPPRPTPQQVVLQLLWNLRNGPHAATPKQHLEFFRLLLPGDGEDAARTDHAALGEPPHPPVPERQPRPEGRPQGLRDQQPDADLADGKAYSSSCTK